MFLHKIHVHVEEKKNGISKGQLKQVLSPL